MPTNPAAQAPERETCAPCRKCGALLKDAGAIGLYCETPGCDSGVTFVDTRAAPVVAGKPASQAKVLGSDEEVANLVYMSFIHSTGLPNAAEQIAAHRHAATAPLVEAAQAVINRWDSPHWKWDDEHTGHKISRLRKAVEAAKAAGDKGQALMTEPKES